MFNARLARSVLGAARTAPRNPHFITNARGTTRRFTSGPTGGPEKPKFPLKPLLYCAPPSLILAYFFRPKSEHACDASHLDPPPLLPTAPTVPPQSTIHPIETGTSHVPHIPSKLYLPSQTEKSHVGTAIPEDAAGEYVLVGHGIRTVSFMKIQVYVLGLYIHKDDLSIVQKHLLSELSSAIDSPTTITTATRGEREKLAEVLNGVTGEEDAIVAMNKLLVPGENGRAVRSLWRITPTRNTDFSHLRDGFVRQITARLALLRPVPDEVQEEGLSQALNEFKAIFTGYRKQAKKGNTLMMIRGSDGGLSVVFDGSGRTDGFLGYKDGDVEFLGRLGASGEGIGRALALCYLAGKGVSSEEARGRVVEGLCAMVERPVGTAEGMVDV
ncbi:hypothetical protein BJ508DRAFT_414353 [Ascobolus immersus RN42]|uniref:Chalcone isomerase domain-containing protein n=1 Tax=Ascobolus immersus RN42 TaxID=1160509 RepID=A0A3N4ID07_ASCIM|nr:hypothetical protein BJ508DRAFT_414353 [Ascobolus immersus RN42]